MKQALTSITLILFFLPMNAQPYRVQVAAYIEQVPFEYFTRADLVGVYMLTDQNDIFRYYIGEFNDKNEAIKVMIKAINVGFKNAQIIDIEEQRKLCGSPCPYIGKKTTYYDESTEFLYVKNIYFDFARSSLTFESKEKLDELLLLMKENPNYQMLLSGHTDAVGKAEINVELSKRRARAAKSYLIYKGVRSSRMKIKVFGESEPVLGNRDLQGKDSPLGRKFNRRVVLTVFDPKNNQIINEYN